MVDSHPSLRSCAGGLRGVGMSKEQKGLWGWWELNPQSFWHLPAKGVGLYGEQPPPHLARPLRCRILTSSYALHAGCDPAWIEGLVFRPSAAQLINRRTLHSRKVFDFAYEPDFLSPAPTGAWRCRRAQSPRYSSFRSTKSAAQGRT